MVSCEAYFNSLIFRVDAIFGTPLLDADTSVMKVVLYVLINVAFISYDMFITVMVRLYIHKYRPKFSKFLK